jgi:hypothetical protein
MTKRIAHAGWTMSALVITFVGVTVTGHPRAAGPGPHQPTSSSSEARVLSVKSKSDLRARTDDEKARAEFFDRYGGEPLEPGDAWVRGPGTPLPPFPPGARLPTYEQFLESLACPTPLVALGRAEQRAVHLNRRETYLFTDYDVAVERWLRPEQAAPSLKLSVSGGRVRIGRKLTSAEDGRPLDPTKRYILFLQPIPGSGFLTLVRTPLAEGDRWATAVRAFSLTQEVANESIRLDSLADDIIRVGRSCAPAMWVEGTTHAGSSR